MILAIDVHYKENTAKAVGALMHSWTDDVAEHYIVKYIHPVEEYIPGAFYKRELPCILAIVNEVDLQQIDYIVIDGFVVLDDNGKPGLGAYVYESLSLKVPVIGVAKSQFHQNTQHVIPVMRGESTKPLYVTAIGTNLQQAAEHIQHMHGDHRLPTLLKELDRVTKEP